MTDTYRKRTFTYAILLNVLDNYEEFTDLGVDPSGAIPGTALVVNRELRIIEEAFGTVAEAEDRYEVVPPPVEE